MGLGCGTIIPIIVYAAKTHYDIRIDSNTRFDEGSEYYQYLNTGYLTKDPNFNDFQDDLKALTKKQ
ncbi:hypothetical protein FACS1894166_02180 [Bacilli bacterium]|nr:hypothetical protein FACS1894166_02180 [Bacilli bacterium]